jgi:predicted short-subunit dehydrogenase-like oxidoreductase (DUF2520 family)
MEVLQPAAHYGVFYPLQSLRKETGRLPETPIIIDASDADTRHLLEQLGRSISPTVVTAGDDERRKLHLAAVFCNNFVNHLYALAESYCRQEGLDFRLLLPLIRETALRVETHLPSAVQTGPAARSDTPTLEAHLRLLDAHPRLREVYSVLTESIRKGEGV